MKSKRTLIFLALALFVHSNLCSQTINIFVHDPLGNFPQISTLQTRYQNAGFATVNITSGMVGPSLTTANYDLAFVTEYYRYSPGAYTTAFLSATERAIVENFVGSGGHVVWKAESWDTDPFSNVMPAQTAMRSTIANLFGVNLSYGVYYNNGGIGPPGLPRVHPSAGPGGLSLTNTITSSGSYATLQNVPPGNAVYAPHGLLQFPFMSLDPCDYTVLALFPAYPVPSGSTGTILVSSELMAPFNSLTDYPILDAAIATLHHTLLTNGNMTGLNSWSAITSNTNPNCPATLPLPVELNNFVVDVNKENEVRLSWSTLGEQQNDYYTLARSVDAASWEAFERVPGADFSDSEQEYATMDENPIPGNSYYRLVQTDLNGESTIVGLSSVFWQPKTMFRLYPNPGREAVKIGGDRSDDMQVTVTSLQGEILMQHEIAAGVNAELDIRQLERGVYLVRIKTRLYHEVHKLTVMHP